MPGDAAAVAGAGTGAEALTGATAPTGATGPPAAPWATTLGGAPTAAGTALSDTAGELLVVDAAAISTGCWVVTDCWT